MKKSTLITSIACVFMMLLSFNTEAQKFSSLDKSPLDVTAYPNSNKIQNKLIKVVYSRPQLKDRELSALIPNGTMWRTGANEATNVTLYKDMKLGGKTVKAGEYSLFTIPGDKEWTIILNKDINVWGSYSYKEANDVIRVMAPVSSGDSLDAFSIAFADNGNMYLGWGTLRVAIPFTE